MASPLHHHDLNSLCVLRGELNPFKVALTCLATCFALNAITTVEAGSGKKPAPLKEFAGAYQGNSSIADVPGPASYGIGQGRFRGRRAGGKMSLYGNTAGNRGTAVFSRNMTFKRRSLRSTTELSTGGNCLSGAGTGRHISRKKSIRYTDDTIFMVDGEPSPVKIVGTVRFYRRLVKVTESWNYGAPPLAFTYHIRRR